MIVIGPRLDDGRETGRGCCNEDEPCDEIAGLREVIIVTNADQRVGGHKSHSRKHRGADIQIDGAAPRLIVLIDGKVASQRRPELRRPNQNYVE